MKTIAVTTDVNLDEERAINKKLAYYAPKPIVDVIVKHGNLPILLPFLPKNEISAVLEKVDGIVLEGGPDVDPTLYGEEPLPGLGSTYADRDRFEIELVKQAYAHQKPVFGICRGIQVINVAFGGTVYQDLYTQDSGVTLQHAQATKGDLPIHHVEIQQDSALYQSVGARPLVNSRHHEAVKDVAKPFKVTAKATDGIIEGIETDDLLVQAVQWHPENLWQRDEQQEKLFTDFFARL